MHTIDRTTRQTGRVDIVANASTTATPARLYAVLRDLTTYPAWLDLVQAVQPTGDAFEVTLRATIGPFARSKQLRMVEAATGDPMSISFVRAETDGRNHANWQLDSIVTETPGGSKVQVTLRYDGSLWSPILERVLRKQIEAATPKLQALVEQP